MVDHRHLLLPLTCASIRLFAQSDQPGRRLLSPTLAWRFSRTKLPSHKRSRRELSRRQFADAPRYPPRRVTNDFSELANDFFEFFPCQADVQGANRSLPEVKSFVTTAELSVTRIWKCGDAGFPNTTNA